MSSCSFFRQVRGFGNRHNDVFYCPPNDDVPHENECADQVRENIVIYFGGDVQNVEKRMMEHRDNHRFSEWSLEKSAALLQTAFPRSEVLVVRPADMFLDTFSKFSNFVPCVDNAGSPGSDPSHGGLEHLRLLIEGVAKRVHGGFPTRRTNNDMQAAKLVLIAFSKGTVVLNQFVNELHYCPGPDDGGAHIRTFWRHRLHTLVWLDAGHNGGKNIYITEKQVLKTLSDLNTSVHVRLTPYQLNDVRRPWIAKEEKIFTAALRKFNAAQVRRTLYFADEDACIENHFRVLTTLLTDPIR